MPKYAFIIVSLICVCSSAQEYVFERISTEDGLSQNDVNCIFKDRQGFMWFGTNDGLNRFDGYDFANFRYNINGGNSLTSNIIISITQDQNQNIWVGTAEGGANIINYSDDKILIPAVNHNETNIFEKEYISEIVVLDDLIMVITKEALFFFIKDKEGYRNILVNNERFLATGSKFTNCYHKVGDNKFFIGTKHGLKILNIHKDLEVKATVISVLDSLNIYKLEPFRNGYLMYCLNDYLYYVDHQLSFTPLIKEQIKCILVEDSKKVWLGTESGLKSILFKDDSTLSIALVDRYDNAEDLAYVANKPIHSIFKDNMGIIWLGTYGHGIIKMVRRTKIFNLYRVDGNESSVKPYVTCFTEDSHQRLWLGTSSGEVSVYDPEVYNYNAKKTEVVNLGYPHSIRLLKEVQLLGESYIIATNDYSTKIMVFDLEANQVNEGRLVDFLTKINRPINAILKDDKYLWVGTSEGGLYRYDYKRNSISWFLTRHNPNLCSNLINALLVDSNSNLLIGTNKGLNILSSEEKIKPNPTFQKFTHKPQDPLSLSYNHITSILQTDDKDIWIGTLGGGLNRFDINNATFSFLTSKDGIVNNSIKGIIADNQNQLWISSNRGLSSFNLSNNEITNFCPSDGLQDYEFNLRTFLKRENGEMLFGGKKGFNAFYPQLIQKDTIKADLVFTGLYVFSPEKNEEDYLNSAKLLQKVRTSQKTPLKYNENSFTIHFSSLNYFAPAEVEYKYRLLGFEESWTNTNYQSRFAKYTNLKAGDYLFEVLATNSDGIWMKKPLRLNLSIAKAWYKSNVAYAFYLLVFITVFIFFNRFSLIRNKKKNALLMERYEKEKINQLTQFRLRFFTNISHELRTPITIIKSYFENINLNWKDLPEEKLKKDLSVISRSVNSLGLLVNQLLDFRKLDQGKMTFSPEFKDIVKLIISRIESFQILAKNKNVDLRFKSEIAKLEFYFDEDKMFKILNNLLSNALKYSPEGGKIELRLSLINNEVKIEIEDQGIGIAPELQDLIFERFSPASSSTYSTESTGIGLSLTKDLVDLHKGRIELTSITGKGSIFTLYFKMDSRNLEVLQKSEPSALLNGHEEAKEIHQLNELPVTTYKNKTVLIVEDNADLLSYLSEKLGIYFNILCAENGRIGLDLCINNTPDIVISDVMMPEMNGYELCNNIKNDNNICHIPIILLTAKTNEESELYGYKLGADAYVGKPFNMDAILARIVSILYSREQMWSRINDNPFFKPSEVTFNSRDEQFLKNVTLSIEKHMSDPEFTVEILAQDIRISKNNLNIKIKALTGRTCVQFIRLLRLRRAAQLLVDKESLVSEVTYAVGYSDLQHFRVHFKNEFSLTPSQYKEKHSVNKEG